MNDRKKTKSKNISDVMLVMSINNWIIGCGVFEYPLGKPQVVLSFVYSTICALTYFCMLFLSAYYDQKIQLENFDVDYSSFSNIFLEVSFFTNGFIVLSTIITGWTRRHGLQLFMEKMERIDKLMGKLGIPKNYDKVYKRQLCLIAFVTLVNIIIITINWVGASIFMCSICELRLKILLTIKNHYPMILLCFNDYNFIGLLWCLKRKFEQLNNLLEKLSETSPFFPQYLKLIYFKTGISTASTARLGQKTNDDTNIMRISKQVHLDLVEICRLTNNNFGFHLLMSLTVASGNIIVKCYYTYIENIDSTEDPKYDQIIASCTFFCFYVMRILVINYICEMTSYEALRTGSIINELYEPTTNKEFRGEIREFTLQLIQNPLTFTACGCYNLGNNFIQKLTGHVSTSLIILIQLRNLSNN